MIDFKNWGRKFDGFGVSVGSPRSLYAYHRAMNGNKELTKGQVRTIYDIDLDMLRYEKGHGLQFEKPAGDLSGTQWELDEKERFEKEGHPTPAG
jgi:hypothetical protein